MCGFIYLLFIHIAANTRVISAFAHTWGETEEQARRYSPFYGYTSAKSSFKATIIRAYWILRSVYPPLMFMFMQGGLEG